MPFLLRGPMTMTLPVEPPRGNISEFFIYLGVFPPKADPVHLLGHSGDVHRFCYPLPHEPVDQGTLANVGEANYRHTNAPWVHAPPHSPVVHPTSRL